VAALDHPGAFSVLTLVGTRAVAPGPPDADLSDHDQAAMSRLFAHEMPDWTDREAVADFAAAGAEILGDDPVEARTVAARIWDRTPGTTPSIQMANQLGTVFSKLDCTPRWRERLPEIGVPTLVLEEAAAASRYGRSRNRSWRPGNLARGTQSDRRTVPYLRAIHADSAERWRRESPQGCRTW